MAGQRGVRVAGFQQGVEPLRLTAESPLLRGQHEPRPRCRIGERQVVVDFPESQGESCGAVAFACADMFHPGSFRRLDRTRTEDGSMRPSCMSVTTLGAFTSLAATSNRE